MGHLSSLTSSEVPRVSQNNISAATRSDAQREHWVPSTPRVTDVSSDPGKQSGKTHKYQPRGAWAPRETQQSGVGARSRVIPPLLPSAGSASILLAWQQPLPPLTHMPSAAVLGFTPASSHRLRATRGAVLEMLSDGAAVSHSLALHRKQQH